jgi:hypothetical protein
VYGLGRHPASAGLWAAKVESMGLKVVRWMSLLLALRTPSIGVGDVWTRIWIFDAPPKPVERQ